MNSDNKPLDESGLIALYGRDGAAEILSLFLKEMRGLLDDGRAMIEQENSEAVARIGHQIKGLSAFIICTEMEPLSRQLEDAARKSDWDTSLRALKSLDDLFARVTVFINQLLPSLSD